MKAIEIRQKDFKNLIWDSVGRTCEKFSKELLIEFFEYWIEHNEPVKANTLMAYEKARRTGKKTFKITGRLATFKRNKETNFGRVKKSKDMKTRFPNYFSYKNMREYTPSEWVEYRTHLQTLGYVFNAGKNGQQGYLIDLEGQRKWL